MQLLTVKFILRVRVEAFVSVTHRFENQRLLFPSHIPSK